MNTDIPKITLPVKVEQEPHRATLGAVWYVEDAAGLKVALSNGPYAKTIADALNAAPELLSALQQILNTYDEEWLSNNAASIFEEGETMESVREQAREQARIAIAKTKDGSHDHR
jgi:hypothetical protein